MYSRKDNAKLGIKIKEQDFRLVVKEEAREEERGLNE